MKIYGVQMLYSFVDDTVTLFTSEKKAIKFINDQREKHADRAIILKKFDFYEGKAIDIEVKLPF